MHEAIHDAVLERVAAAARAIKPGIPTEQSTAMGSLISKEQFDKVMRYIGYGVEDGARLVAGGKAPQDAHLSKGFFVEPTIFADVTPKMRIAREEIFGPVLSVFRWADEAEMLHAVNDVEYGLTASIGLATSPPRIASPGASRRVTYGSTARARITSPPRSAATSSRASAGKSRSKK